MISIEIRNLQLVRLTQTLEDVLAVLQLDEQCPWTPLFQTFLQRAHVLATEGFTQGELDAFSRSLCNVLEPNSGSFCEYQPGAELPAEGLHGTNNFETFRRAAHMQALQLRAID